MTIPPVKKARKTASTKAVASSAKSDQKREEIVRVATEIINNKSYAEATVIDIAAALGAHGGIGETFE